MAQPAGADARVRDAGDGGELLKCMSGVLGTEKLMRSEDEVVDYIGESKLRGSMGPGPIKYT